MAKPECAENSLHKAKTIHEFEFDKKHKASIKCKANTKNMTKLECAENSLRKTKPVHKFELDQKCEASVQCVVSMKYKPMS